MPKGPRGEKRPLWYILRRMMGARLDLPMGEMRGAINQLPETEWQQAEHDRRTKEREQRDEVFPDTSRTTIR